MKIILAKSAGFCFGVKRAIDIALQAASSRKNIYMLGDIVHNEQVVRQIRNAGIKKTGMLTYGKGKSLIIRAHGIPESALQKVLRLGYKVIDATCPMVKEIHHIVRRMENERCKVIVIGDKQHDEVRGIVGQLKGKAIIIDKKENIPLKEIKGVKKGCVVVQSTQNMENALKIVSKLNRHIHSLKFFNTVCRPTRMKQQEIKTMPLLNDVMIIIGSKSSANTKRLYEISKSLNKRSHWVSSKKEIRRDWFKSAKSVGVTAGASTPDSTTQEIMEHIKRLGH